MTPETSIPPWPAPRSSTSASFQQELASRLATKTAAQVESSRLGLACGGAQWLIRLADAGEVITLPPVASVPLTQPWFLGIANIRGNLYTVIDFGAFLGREAERRGGAGQSRLILFGPRAGELRAGIVVQRVLGLAQPGGARAGGAARPTRPIGSGSAGWMPRVARGRRSISRGSRRTPRFLRVGLVASDGA